MIAPALPPDPELDEMKRVAAWLDRPGWMRFWDRETEDLIVPDGWPPPINTESTEPVGPPEIRTPLHDMLDKHLRRA